MSGFMIVELMNIDDVELNRFASLSAALSSVVDICSTTPAAAPDVDMGGGMVLVASVSMSVSIAARR